MTKLQAAFGNIARASLVMLMPFVTCNTEASCHARQTALHTGTAMERAISFCIESHFICDKSNMWQSCDNFG
jgi:hypothetical protein